MASTPATTGSAGTGSKKRSQGEIDAEQDDGDETPSKKAKVEAESKKGAKNYDDA